MKQIHITTGDLDGVGLEVTLKSLVQIGPKRNIQFILWRSSYLPSSLKKYLGQLKKTFNYKTSSDFLKNLNPKINFLDIQSKNPPTSWVQSAALICLKDKTSKALVTGPLSKVQIKKDGFNFKGHTDLLKNITKRKNLFMCFIGSQFNVILLTDHIPLKNIKITKQLLNQAIKEALLFRNKFLKNKKPLGLLGLNPHSGEKGLLGLEEKNIYHLVLKKYNKKEVFGPLVPDTSFYPSCWKKYSFYLSSYHDQGLIPFKMIHQNKGIHTTIGLNFIRTSVVHGTAKDIFNKNKALAFSMEEAIKRAISFLLDFSP